MSLYYEHNVRLSGMDTDGRGICKASALLDYLQVAAGYAAEEGGFGREVLMEGYGAFWMLARSWFRLDRPLRWEDEITIQTWHRGAKGAMMYRDYDILANGKLVGESVSGWVLASMDSHKMLRLSNIKELCDTDGGGRCKDITLSKLRLPTELQSVEKRLMRYSDTDINGHVNNTRYADFACDALDMARLPGDRFLSSMQIGYLAECRPGEELTLLTGREGEEHFVSGVDEAGKTRFEVQLNFGKVLP